jgi:hypothetical protein
MQFAVAPGWYGSATDSIIATFCTWADANGRIGEMVATNENPGDVLFEFRQVGTVIRVAAIDPASGTEVTVMGPASASRSDLQRLALNKLKARLSAKGS